MLRQFLLLSILLGLAACVSREPEISYPDIHGLPYEEEPTSNPMDYYPLYNLESSLQ